MDGVRIIIPNHLTIKLAVLERIIHKDDRIDELYVQLLSCM